MKILGLLIALSALGTAGYLLSVPEELSDQSPGEPAGIRAAAVVDPEASAPRRETVARKTLETRPEEKAAFRSAIAAPPVPSGGGDAEASTTGPPEVELRYRFQSGGLSLPLHWLALDHFVWDGDPIPLENGKMG